MKHLFISFIFNGGCLLAACTAQAQSSFSIGPEVGFNVSGASYQTDGNTQIIYRSGFQAGIQSVLQFGHLAVQPSLRFSQQGYHYHYGYQLRTDDTDYRLNYLVLPLNIAYSLRSDGQGLHVFAGPYAGLLLGGDYHRTINDRSGGGGGTFTYDGQVRPGNDQPFGSNDTYRRQLDLGLQAGVGYRFGALLAQADFSFGLRRIDATAYNSVGSGIYNRTAQFSLSYLLNSKRS